MKTIDITKRVDLQIEGLTRGQWVLIASSEAEVPSTVEYDEKLELLHEGLDQFTNVFNHCYKEDSCGYVQLGDTSIAIHRFDAMRVSYLQDGEQGVLPAKDK